MESDLQHQKQLNPGLTRYQSAPSSYFASILDSESLEEFLNRPSSPETERIFARFLSSSGVTSGNNNENASIQNLETINEREIEIKSEPQNQITGQMNDGSGYLHQQQQQQQNQTNFSSASPGFYQSQRWPENPNPGSNMDYATPGTMGSDRLPPMRTAGSRNSNLIRHQSSPAGLFANIDIERIGEMKGFGDYTANIVRSDPEEAFPAASRPFSSSGLMTPNADIMDKNMGLDNSGNAAAFGNNIRDDYSAGFQVGSWDASSLRRLADEDRTLSGPNEYEIQQKPDAGNRPPLLAHHLSLPKGSAEMSAFEKLLQYQDSVPCKMRAKRGFATHPRSIAERVRRTKISERMRKLQDLVPNMDKQTSTADMLDLAVDYIKDLQEQVKVLSDSREKCSCSDQDQDQDQDRQQQ